MACSDGRDCSNCSHVVTRSIRRTHAGTDCGRSSAGRLQCNDQLFSLERNHASLWRQSEQPSWACSSRTEAQHWRSSRRDDFALARQIRFPFNLTKYNWVEALLDFEFPTLAVNCETYRSGRNAPSVSISSTMGAADTCFLHPFTLSLIPRTNHLRLLAKRCHRLFSKTWLSLARKSPTRTSNRAQHPMATASLPSPLSSTDHSDHSNRLILPEMHPVFLRLEVALIYPRKAPCPGLERLE